MSTGIFGENAWQYWGLGFRVIPVKGKFPCGGMTKWSRWSTEEQTEDELHNLIDTYDHEATGIAAVAGVVSGIDIDTNDIRLLSMVPRSPMTRFGSKGILAIYRGHPNLRKRNAGMWPVEQFGLGSYFVLPGSVHPDTGKLYEWRVYEPCNVSDLPELPVDTFDVITAEAKKLKIYRPNLLLKTAPSGNDVEYDPNDKGRGNRNNYLTRAAYAMACAPQNLHLSIDQLADKLLLHDRIIHKGDAWFDDPKEPGRSPHQRAIKFMERAMKASYEVTDEDPTTTVEIDHQAALALTLKQLAEHGGGKLASPFALLKERMRKLIIKGGMIELIDGYVTDISKVQNPMFSITASLSLISTLAGHKYHLLGTHPNIIVFCLAPTGAGKSGPQNAVKWILKKTTNGGSLIGPGTYASSTSIYQGLSNNKVRIDLIDECKTMFTTSKFTTGNNHLSGFEDDFCKLYSASGGSVEGKVAIKKESQRPAINNPCLSQLMCSTIAAFYEYFESTLLDHGLGGRALYMADDFSGSMPEDTELYGKSKNGTLSFVPPAVLIARCNQLLGMPLNKEIGAYTEGGYIPDPIGLELTPEADKLLVGLQNHYKQQNFALSLMQEGISLEELQEGGSFKKEAIDALQADDIRIQGVKARALENMRKALIVYAVSQNITMLDVDAVHWAHELYKISEDTIRFFMLNKQSHFGWNRAIGEYKKWARSKIKVSKLSPRCVEPYQLERKVREWLQTFEQRHVDSFIEILTKEGLGHWVESSELSSNGRRKMRFGLGQKS